MSERSPLVRALPCIACSHEGVKQPNRSTEHHLNLGGNAGQRRRGDAESISLCRWHHQAHRLPGMNNDQMTATYGPSLALDSRQFRFAYGTDDQLLALTNAQLERQCPQIA